MNKNDEATEVSEIDLLLCHTAASDFSINKSERKAGKAQVFLCGVFAAADAPRGILRSNPTGPCGRAARPLLPPMNHQLRWGGLLGSQPFVILPESGRAGMPRGPDVAGFRPHPRHCGTV